MLGTNPNGFNGELMGGSQIEVLKGPQGALYGRNAAAGVVNMVPNAPGDQDEGFLRYRAGNYALNRWLKCWRAIGKQ